MNWNCFPDTIEPHWPQSQSVNRGEEEKSMKNLFFMFKVINEIINMQKPIETIKLKWEKYENQELPFCVAFTVCLCLFIGFSGER